MSEIEVKSKKATLSDHGIDKNKGEHWNLPPARLVEMTLERGLGELADNGALCIDTGKFTGRSPKDKFCVKDEMTADRVWWGNINQPISPENFAKLRKKMVTYMQGKELFVRDMYACAEPNYRLKVRVVTTLPWQSLFVDNMFIRPSAGELEDFEPDWVVLDAPGLEGDGPADGLRRGNFSILNFSEKMVLVGGSGYTGEIKKGIFTVLNYLLPQQGVLSMHCSANEGKDGDTAVFFGLSGTGKTTLSADPERKLIGDDEHGWSDDGIFNFEGGCYAKVIDLSEESEPEIWNAIRFRSLVENTRFKPGTRVIDYANTEITENTRVSYPIDFIEGAKEPAVGKIPRNIFFLTCDAFGVLPPISKLRPGQAMYHFLSGYTAKVAGTEEGVDEPQPSFSACFGAPFLPLHPTEYATMLGEKMRAHKTNIWLVNTGWNGGSAESGASRIRLRYTRAMINAALRGDLDKVDYETDKIFGLSFPVQVPVVPDEILNPRKTWKDPEAYDAKAYMLAARFNKEFAKYSDYANDEIMQAAPKERESVG